MSTTDFIDWTRLSTVVKLAVRFLDNVIDMNKYIIPEIEIMTKATRKIGLGVMGWADLLVQLGIPYDSIDATSLADKVMRCIQNEADAYSKRLALERGVFPAYSGSTYSIMDGNEFRNSTRTTIAPTGTISLIAGTSSGVEPLFAICYQHHGLEDSIKDTFVNPYFEAVAKKKGFYSPELMEKIAEHGSCQGIDEVPTDVQSIFITAHEINPRNHVLMQSAFQRRTDNAVSKTINFSSSASLQDVEDAYLLAYKEGCKGITIYRDGSREGQVITTGYLRPVEETTEEFTETKRPDVLDSKTIKQLTPFGNLYVTVSECSPGDPLEVFATIGKAGSDVQAMTEAACRSISQMLRISSPTSRRERLQLLADQFSGIGGYASTGFGTDKVYSIPDAIAKALYKYLGQNEVSSTLTVNDSKPLITVYMDSSPPYSYGAMCADCGQTSVHMLGGCMTCQECGWSQC